MCQRKPEATLLSDTRGSVSLLFAMIALLLFSFIGAAVDYSRWNNARSRTSDALDAALLTAGRSLQTARTKEEAIAAAETVFLQNAKTRLSLIAPKITVQMSADGTSLEGVASGKMKTPFMRLLRYGALDVTATSKVGFGFGSAGGGSDLEISMMLDVTGSMCDDGNGPCASSAKLDALKTAASDLTNIVMSNATGANVRISLVPFSTRVRIGPTGDPSTETMMKRLTNLDPLWSGYYKECLAGFGSGGSETFGGWTCTNMQVSHVSNWILMPCVADRTASADDFTDAAPGPNRWILGNDGTRFPLSWDSLDMPLASLTGTSSADAAEYWTYSGDGICYDIEDPILPLSSDKQLVLDRISALRAFGSTSGALGTAWTWYTLSPNWASIWPSNSEPGPYLDLVPSGSNPPKLRKIAVLMTDGVYNTLRSWKDSDPVITSNNAKQICTNMKAQGIEIYTIGFDLDSLSAADKARAMDTLQSCGTDIQHFYDALDTAQLQQSFRDIAMQLSQLYIAR